MVSYELIRDQGILVIMPEGPLRTEDFQALSQAVDDYIVSDEMELPVAVEVLSAFPHAHYLARAMHVTATLPNGSIDSLLTIDDWQFGKQLEYQFAEPRRLPVQPGHEQQAFGQVEPLRHLPRRRDLQPAAAMRPGLRQRQLPGGRKLPQLRGRLR